MSWVRIPLPTPKTPLLIQQLTALSTPRTNPRTQTGLISAGSGAGSTDTGVSAFRRAAREEAGAVRCSPASSVGIRQELSPVRNVFRLHRFPAGSSTANYPLEIRAIASIRCMRRPTRAWLDGSGGRCPGSASTNRGSRKRVCHSLARYSRSAGRTAPISLRSSSRPSMTETASSRSWLPK